MEVVGFRFSAASVMEEMGFAFCCCNRRLFKGYANIAVFLHAIGIRVQNIFFSLCTYI
jgi:hypothetical protein